jgi:predicted MFS family arabinose efflux permease
VFHDLRVGWHDFWSRRWLWAIVIQFGVVNALYTGTLFVLGPAVAKRHLGGPAAWAGVLVAIEAGVIASGLVLLRWKPRRLLRTATFGAFGLALPLVALARPEPLVVVIVAAFASGYLTEIFGVLWDTTYQQEIPHDKLSRLSSYDAIGSWALMPLGFAVAGPVGSAVGTRASFIGAAVIVVAATAVVLLSRDVRTLERRDTQPARA